MPKPRSVALALLAACVTTVAPPAHAHVNPPLVLLSDRDAMTTALPGAEQFPQADVKLSPQQKQALHKEWGWKCDDRSYRVYEGRDGQGRAVGAVVFLTQPTLHSPVRVAVGLGKDGRITGAAVVEVSEESYSWVKPLIDRDFTKAYVGQGARGEFTLPEGAASGRQRTMEQFYAKVITFMIQRGAALYQVALAN